MKNLMMMCCVAIAAWGAMAESVVTNGYTWTYSVADGKATIWVVRPAPTGALEIPATLAGNPVDAIGDSLFQECNGLTGVTILPCITSIGEMAFADCVNLSQVTLPSNIGTLTIGAHAFDNGTTVDVTVRQGYSLSWTNAMGEVMDDPFHAAASVTVSPRWTRVEPWNFTEGLAAHYTFDGNANDASGNGNNGVLHDVTTTVDRHGNVDGAYHFNGTSAYIEVPDSDSLRKVGQAITLSAWINPKEYQGNWISVLTKGNGNKRQYGFEIGSSQWVFYNPANSDVRVITSESIVLNDWNHVAITYTANAITAYLNGTIVGRMVPTGNILEDTGSLYIGIDPPYGSEYLSGDMDEVRIYNRCLSAAEIRTLANGDQPVASSTGEGSWFYQYDIAGGIGMAQAGIGQFDSTLSIPSMIDGNAVVSIGRYGFADNGDIETVNLPASVKEVGDFAFSGCSNLVQVTLSKEIGNLTVGGNAFDTATEVRIGDKDGYVFVGWTNSVGATVTDPFHRTKAITVTPVWKKIETATIDGRIWTYSVSDNGLATIGDGTTNAVAPALMGDIAIPDEIGGYPVVGIGGYAFAGCSEITSLTIASNVTSIGIGAFEGCTGLTNLVVESETLSCSVPGLMQAKFDTRFDTTSTLDDSADVQNVSGVIAAYTQVTSAPWEFIDPITGSLFYWKESNSTFLYSGQMYLEEGNTYVFGVHFDDDAQIKVNGQTLLTVRYPETEKKIGVGRYVCGESGWHDLEIRLGDIDGRKGSWGKIWSADFGLGYRNDGSTNSTQSGWSRLLDPGDGSLFRCSGMRMVFAGCSNLVSVTMPWSLVARMSTMFPDAYDKLETVTLTGDTETIPVGAFSGCSSLRSIEMPRSVSKIGRQAFKNCEAIERLVIPSGKVIVEDGAFEGCNAIRSVVLPLDISRCGLIQAKFDEDPTNLTSSIIDSDTRANVSGVIMGYAYDNASANRIFTDPIFGGNFRWNSLDTTFGYLGHMYMEAGKEYVFGEYFDTFVFVAVDGVEVLMDSSYADFSAGSYLPEVTGWHRFEIRVGDHSNDKGPTGAQAA